MEPCDLLFVYGTLRRSSAHPIARWLRLNSTFLGEAKTSGELIDLGAYPGMIDTSHPNKNVSGDLFRLHNTQAALKRLDRYEGCGPGFRSPTEYVRILRNVSHNGERVEAWLYLYNQVL
ncbi:MAG: gamma-glutamylcyclotransferase family protein [Gammaproteobacteria bacterium]